MKKFLLTVLCVGMASAPAFAGGCGGCGGGKKKEGEKPKDAPKQTLVSPSIS